LTTSDFFLLLLLLLFLFLFVALLVTRRALVEFDGNKTVMPELPIDSLEGMTVYLREQLSISSSMVINYMDDEFGEYAHVSDVSLLPKEKLRLKVVVQALNWWGWSPDSSWASKGFDTTRYHSLLVKEGTKIHNTLVLDKFKAAAGWLGFNTDQVHKIYAVSNSKLLTNFENYRDTLMGKHRASPGLFKKTDWTEMDPDGRRKLFLDWFLTSASKYEWNYKDAGKPKVVPMLQGTSEQAVWQICQQGFGVTATTDAGFYGKGVYFTSKLQYAANYSKESPGEGRVFLLSMVVPGNVFPVTEHPEKAGSLLGQACRTGYQSHFTIVESKDYTQAFPTPKSAIDPTTTADELVTFNDAQAVPVFVFYVK
jgi:hypothetical protein